MFSNFEQCYWRDEDILKVSEFGNKETIVGLLPTSGTEALAPTGHRLAAAGIDRNIYVWESTVSSSAIDKSGNWEKCAVLHPKPLGHWRLIPTENDSRASQ